MRKLIKSPSQIEKIRKSGEILSDVLRKLSKEVKPGILSMDLENMTRELIENAGGKPAFLGYKPEGALHPFPYALCSSVNEVVVHGRPSDTPLKEGLIKGGKAVTGRDIGTTFISFSSNAGYVIRKLGVPGVAFAPGNIMDVGSNEHVEINKLIEGTKILAAGCVQIMSDS